MLKFLLGKEDVEKWYGYLIDSVEMWGEMKGLSPTSTKLYEADIVLQTRYLIENYPGHFWYFMSNKCLLGKIIKQKKYREVYATVVAIMRGEFVTKGGKTNKKGC